MTDEIERPFTLTLNAAEVNILIPALTLYYDRALSALSKCERDSSEYEHLSNRLREVGGLLRGVQASTPPDEQTIAFARGYVARRMDESRARVARRCWVAQQHLRSLTA